MGDNILGDERNYKRINVITFKKTKELYGGLSNMAPGFPIKINNIMIRNSEALYQALRYTEHPEIQKEIIMQNSPMTSKMKSKKHRALCREDWNDIRLKVMRWCLRVKLIQNWDSFGGLLIDTGDKQIVEESNKDRFWGAIPFDDGSLNGINALGRLLMELREEMPIYLTNKELSPLKINNFKLMGVPIEGITFNISEMPDMDIRTKNTEKFINISIFDKLD